MPRPVPTYSADLRCRTAFCPRSARVLDLVLALALSSIATFGNRLPSLTAHFSGSLSPVVTGPLFGANGFAVDGSGNLYIADHDAGSVYKETPSAGGYSQSVVASGLGWPTGVAVDASGDLFVAYQAAGVVQEATPGVGGYTQTTLPLDLSAPTGVAVDSGGNVYVADPSSGELWKCA